VGLTAKDPVAADCAERFGMADEKHNSDDVRKAYEAPKVTRISLRPEEAVLGICKIMGHNGPFAGLGGCLSVTPCSAMGS
jgi:hypothetical protein